MSLATQTPPATTPSLARRPRTSVEAARYGVLRRLAPALKHDMVVHLQAVAMMAEVLSARLEKGGSVPVELQNSVSRMNRLAREAVMSCLKVTAWIEPAEDEAVALHDGVRECLGLLQSNFNFRGFTLHNDVPTADFEVSRSGLLNLLSASLITLTDIAEGPADVRLQGELAAGVAVLTLSCEVRPPEPDSLPWEVNYRQLDWADVQALALAESIELQRHGSQIVMRIPRMVATTPLKIVPV